MEITLSFIVVAFFLQPTLSSGRDTDPLICPDGEYLERSMDKCLPCMECPINQIVRKPCNSHRNTQCGPFYEFEDFNHGYSVENYQEMQSDVDVHEKNEPAALQDDAAAWRELCYGLIGALVAVTLLAGIYVFLTQLRARRAASGKTITIHDPTDPSVYYQAQIIRSTSSGNSGSSPSESSRPSSAKRSRTPALDAQIVMNNERRNRVMQLFPSNRTSGNVYVDPLGRVYGGDEELNHPFVRTRAEDEMRSPIYMPHVHRGRNPLSVV